jgi:plastocyanin
LPTRRGFVAAASLGILSLYGVWTAYDAAPGFGAGDDGQGDGHGEDEMETLGAAAGHGDHGAGASDAAAGFREEARAFIDRYRLPDGSVQPSAPAAPSPSIGAAGLEHSGGHGGHAGAAAPSPADERASGVETPVDVYLLVQQWMFEPAVLHLAAGVPYRFRMLAADVSHGASLQLGAASRIVRLRPGVPTELVARFTRPGEYLVYCTVYCGPGHDQMAGRLIVA